MIIDLHFQLPTFHGKGNQQETMISMTRDKFGEFNINFNQKLIGGQLARFKR